MSSSAFAKLNKAFFCICLASFETQSGIRKKTVLVSPLFEKEGLGEIFSNKSPSIPRQPLLALLYLLHPCSRLLKGGSE